MKWSGDLVVRLEAVRAKTEDITDDVAAGAEVILAESELRVPKEAGALAGTGRVEKDRGGKNTVGITYDGPYARYQHEHLGFKHPHGGQAKFLETAMLEKGEEAKDKAGEHLWERL